MADVMT